MNSYKKSHLKAPIKSALFGILACATTVSMPVDYSFAQDGFPTLDVEGFVDFRLASGSRQQSWIDGGFGKVRYGTGQNIADRFAANLAEGSLILRSQLSFALSGKLHIAFTPEQKNEVDVVEAYIEFRPVSTSRTRYSLKAGNFFPSMSMENIGIGWTSPYSITPSAINTWIGEEVKASGAEVEIERRNDDFTLKLRAAGFFRNDPTTSLLGWRGWALHDVKTTFFNEFPLPQLRSIGPNSNMFRRQPFFVRPEYEVDGRIGYWVGANIVTEEDTIIDVIYYDNRGSLSGFKVDQYAFDARFLNVGISTFLPSDIELVAQYLTGVADMGTPSAQGVIPYDIDYRSFFIMVSKAFDTYRLTVRYDDFKVDDNTTVAMDDNNEDGWALMGAFGIELGDHHRIMTEILRVQGTRPERLFMGLPLESKDTQVQISYRFSF